MASRWCPTCGAEYREGFTECADCGAGLTDQPPAPEPKARHHATELLHGPFSPEDDTVELVRTNPAEAEVMVAELRSAGIPALVFGSGGLDVYAVVLARTEGVRVMVRRKDMAVAAALLTDSAGDTTETGPA